MSQGTSSTKRGFQKGSPTGASPPLKKPGIGENFADNFVTALSDQRVVSALQAIFTGSVQAELKARDEKIESLQKENADLASQISALSDRVDKLESSTDDQEQYSRRNSLRFSTKIPETDRECCDDIVINVINEMGVENVTLADIDRSHRVGKRGNKTRAIICKFKSYKARASVFAVKKNAPNGVYVSEDLTSKKAVLLYKARVLKREGKMKQCWSYDGRIYIKKLNDDTKVIYDETHMMDILNKDYAKVAATRLIE
jgi:hypothetical protein